MPAAATKISLKTYINTLNLYSAEGMESLTRMLANEKNVSVSVSWGVRKLSIAPFDDSISLEFLAQKMREACEPHWNHLFLPDDPTPFHLPAWNNTLTVLSLVRQQYDKISRVRYCCLKALLLWIYDFFTYTKQHLNEATQFMRIVSTPQYTLIDQHFHLNEKDTQPAQFATSPITPGYYFSKTALQRLAKQNPILVVP